MIADLEARAAEFGLGQRVYSKRVQSDGEVDGPGSVVGRSWLESYSTFKPMGRQYLDPIARAVFEDPLQFAIPVEEYASFPFPECEYTALLTRRFSSSPCSMPRNDCSHPQRSSTPNSAPEYSEWLSPLRKSV